MFEDEDDELTLNFADLKLKSVHAGHLFKVTIGTRKISITDQKNWPDGSRHTKRS